MARSKSGLRDGLLASAAFAACCLASTAVAAQQADVLELEAARGKMVELARPVSAVFVADVSIADVQSYSDQVLHVIGKAPGQTSLYAVSEGGKVVFERTVRVIPPISALKEAIAAVANSDSVDVVPTGSGVTINGQVETSHQLAVIEKTLQDMLGEEVKVVNNLTSLASDQVNLQVRIVELTRDVANIFGVNLAASAGRLGDELLAFAIGRDFFNSTGQGAPLLRGSSRAGTTGNLGGSFEHGEQVVTGVLDALEREGLAHVLAEPVLTTRSGTTANFLVGGEFPIPIAQDDEGIKVEFKQFGVELAFTPHIQDGNKIMLEVAPEISELSDAGSVTIGGLVIPGLSTRRVETTVSLLDGESLAIGGLFSRTTRANLNKFPGLGDIPLLGRMFKSNDYSMLETELMIFVKADLQRDQSMIYDEEPPSPSRLSVFDTLFEAETQSPSATVNYTLSNQENGRFLY